MVRFRKVCYPGAESSLFNTLRLLNRRGLPSNMLRQPLHHVVQALLRDLMSHIVFTVCDGRGVRFQDLPGPSGKRYRDDRIVEAVADEEGLALHPFPLNVKLG